MNVSKDLIRDVFLRNGFTIKEGQTDLKPYVYAAAEELLQAALAQQPAQAAQEPVAWCVPPMTRPYWGEYAEADAKAEAARIGGTARAIPLYTAPPAAEQPDPVVVPREVLRVLTDTAITEWHDPSESEANQDKKECQCCGVQDGHNADCAVSIALHLLAGGEK